VVSVAVREALQEREGSPRSKTCVLTLPVIGLSRSVPLEALPFPIVVPSLHLAGSDHIRQSRGCSREKS
jgi:hypothetical protein